MPRPPKRLSRTTDVDEGESRVGKRVPAGDRWRAKQDYISGMEVPEIAARRGVAEDTVRRWIDTYGWVKDRERAEEAQTAAAIDVLARDSADRTKQRLDELRMIQMEALDRMEEADTGKLSDVVSAYMSAAKQEQLLLGNATARTETITTSPHTRAIDLLRRLRAAQNMPDSAIADHVQRLMLAPDEAADVLMQVIPGCTPERAASLLAEPHGQVN